MNSEEITFVFCSIDSLAEENRKLRARLEAVEQNAKSLSLPSSAAAEYNARSVESATDELALLCSPEVEPLSTKRLDEIKRSIGATKSTWADLRQLYPPGQSGFAPRTDSGNELDAALSQAATMASYGVELLRIALNGTQVNRRLTRQTSHLLATLCSTLISTRDQRRRPRDTNASSGREDKSFRKRIKLNIYPKPHRNDERPNVPDTNNRRNRPDLRVTSGSELTDLDSDYLWQESRQPNAHKKQRTPNATPNIDSTTPTVCDPNRASDITTKVNAIGNSASASDADAEEELDLVVGQVQVARLHRRVVIQNALISQGLTESAANAYIDRISKDTNLRYDGLWSKWVAWCCSRELDPLERSETNLTTFLSDGTKSKSWTKKLRSVARSVWSTIEGSVLHAECKALEPCEIRDCKTSLAKHHQS